MKRRLSVFISLLFGCFLSSSLAFSESLLRVDMEYILATKAPSLLFTITNISKSDLIFNAADLPWGNRYSVLIIGSTKSQPCLQQTHFIDDPRPDSITIKSGEKVQGTIALKKHIENFDEVLRKEDVLLFWHYEAKTKDTKEVGQYGGWIKVNKIDGFSID